MTGAFGAEGGHLWDTPVVEHVVNITHAQTGAIEPYQELIILWLPVSSKCTISQQLLVLGSGTSTSCTSTRKSGPSFTTTPAMPFAGISSDILGGIERKKDGRLQ